MYLKRIEIKNFRNLEQVSLDFDKNVNIILGKNAQGKTNILEAIYALSGNKSFRGAGDRELFNFSSENYFISGIFNDDEENLEIKIGAEKGESIKKNVVRNEKVYKSQRALVGAAPMTVFSPDDLELIKDGPVNRRNYCDLLISTLFPFYLKTLSRYNRILSQKNAVLKSEENNKNLEIWNEQLALYGASIIKSRVELLKRLVPYVKNIFFEMAGEKEEIDISYKCNITENLDLEEQEIRNLILEKLNQNSFKEINAKNSLYGPHRDDIFIEIKKKDARQFASQGQQRSAVLALLLAKTELIKKESGKTPIILLDDVMSELDDTRRNYLTEKIKGFQVFITCCQDELYKDSKQKTTFIVENGKIEKKEE